MKQISVRRTLILLASLMAVILVAPNFAPYDIQGSIDVSPVNNRAPSWEHVMGTNKVDTDLFSLVLKGSQVSLVIATAATAIALSIGTLYGTLAAFLGGWQETLLMRTTEISFAVPRFIILLAVASIAGPSMSTAHLVLLIGLTGWFDVARIARGEVAALLQRDWTLAARAAGAGPVRIAFKHIFPHLVPILTVIATLGIGHTIILEAGLMYLGAGGSSSSLGYLLQEGSGSATQSNWWLNLFPGLAIVLIVLACNTLGNALRDLFAPEQVHAWPTT